MPCGHKRPQIFTMATETSSVLQAEDILKLLKERDVLDTYDLSLEFKVDHQQIVGTIKSLSSLGDVSILILLNMCVKHVIY